MPFNLVAGGTGGEASTCVPRSCDVVRVAPRSPGEDNRRGPFGSSKSLRIASVEA